MYSLVEQWFHTRSPKFWDDGAIRPHLAAGLATVTDGYAVLIILLQMHTRRQLMPPKNRQICRG